MAKLAERLTILNNAGQQLLTRLGYIKKVLAIPTQRPQFIGEPQFSKANTALLKKFPEFEANVEKTPGYELLTGKSKIFFDDLEPYYFAFVDVFEFKENAVACLNEAANSVTTLTMDDNPTLTISFFDLLTLYAQITFLQSMIEDRKLILAVYYKLFFFIRCTNEPNFARVANYAVACDNPVKIMQDELRTLTPTMTNTLISFFPLYSKMRTVAVLRKEGALSITLKPEEMTRPVTDKSIVQLGLDSQMTLWIVFGYLICPEALVPPGAIDLLKTALQEGFSLPLIRNVVLQIHNEFESMLGSYKGPKKEVSKFKKAPKEALDEFGKKGLQKHKEKRIYLRQELNSLVQLCTDQPGLLGPKFPLILSALSMAKSEVFWYFSHLKQAPPKGGKKFTEEESRDSRISELLFLIDSTCNIVRSNRQIIQRYYLEYLRGADLRKLREISTSQFMSAVGTGISQILRSAMDELSSVNENSDFKALRLNWFRIEASLSGKSSPTPLLKNRELVDRFNLITNHTKYVDDLDGLLERHASLAGLWYHKESFVDAFSRALKEGPNQPYHTLAFFRIMNEFPQTATNANPEERDEIGDGITQIAQRFFNEMTDRVVAILNEMAKNFISFDSQTADVNAAYMLLLKRKDVKVDKNAIVPVPPGSESNYRKRATPTIDRLRLYERNAFQLCSVLNKTEELVIFDQVLAPREYLKERIRDGLSKFIKASWQIDIGDEKHPEKALQRPTIFEKNLHSYINAIKTIENYVDLDIGVLVAEVLLQEAYVPALGKSNTLDWINVDDPEIYKFSEQSSIVFIAQWYGDFVARKLNTPGVVYSPLREGFVSRAGLPFRADLYADVTEMKSLCNIVGPYGCKMIDREVLKFILNMVNSLKETLSNNKNVLEELRMNFTVEAQCTESLKRLRDADSFMQKAIAIGNALYFRELLQKGQMQSVSENVPQIARSVQNSFSEYRRNTFMAPELLPMDLLAKDAGIPLETADQPLKRFLSKSIGSADAALWDYLPLMFAASFTSNVWREAVYKPVVEAHVNNAHTLAKAINDLIIAFKAVTTSTGDEKEIVTLLRSFVEISSIILLRIARQKADKHTPVDFPSVIIFMDKFVQASPLLTADVLEECLPYSLLRNEYSSIYSNRGKKEVSETF
eukprot:TRINITY_DN1660_c0_g1_i1.p1 TRINITY_DN1660_c0_g1~~TRINITY_DN1660_c0_g1_i1.p1  ORF type:complete len:1147 (-),score=374.72 TRINITY_DN1660_c0_g1_i1:168-3608(-)